MAWNQSGKNSPGGWGRNSGPLPPGLDDLLKKLNGFFGGGRDGGINALRIAAWLCGFLLLLWGLLGFYRVTASEQAVVFRVGRILVVHDEGLYWNPPVLDVVRRLDRSRIEQASVTAPVLTEDAGILDLSMQVEYRVGDAQAYLLRTDDPESLLVHAAESALHRVAGAMTVDALLVAPKEYLAAVVQKQLQADMERYQAGLVVTSVSLTEMLPPAELRPAFEDVARARDDGERLQAEARQQVAGLVPAARTKAAALLAEAEVYRRDSVNRAGADAERFTRMLAEYRLAPEAVRQRLYYDTMESVLAKTRVVIVDGRNNEVFSLPLDRMVLPESSPATGKAPVVPLKGVSK